MINVTDCLVQNTEGLLGVDADILGNRDGYSSIAVSLCD